MSRDGRGAPELSVGLRAVWLLPHELLFGAFFLTVIAELLRSAAQSRLLMIAFGFYLAIAILLIPYSLRRPNLYRWRARLGYYPLITAIVYFQIPAIVAATHPWFEDHRLQLIDRWLAGGDLSIAMQSWASPLPTEILSIAYQSYILYYVTSQLRYFLEDVVLATRFFIGFFTIFALGFLGYILIPAHGPYIALAKEFTAPLSGWFFTNLSAEIIRVGSNKVDVFPSLHCAIPAFVLAFDFIHKRRSFWIWLAPSLLSWLACVYLRYHYLVDVLAGFALAFVALIFALCWPVCARRKSEQSGTEPTWPSRHTEDACSG